MPNMADKLIHVWLALDELTLGLDSQEQRAEMIARNRDLMLLYTLLYQTQSRPVTSQVPQVPQQAAKISATGSTGSTGSTGHNGR